MIRKGFFDGHDTLIEWMDANNKHKEFEDGWGRSIIHYLSEYFYKEDIDIDVFLDLK